jgi:hypothetical protein
MMGVKLSWHSSLSASVFMTPCWEHSSIFIFYMRGVKLFDTPLFPPLCSWHHVEDIQVFLYFIYKSFINGEKICEILPPNCYIWRNDLSRGNHLRLPHLQNQINQSVVEHKQRNISLFFCHKRQGWREFL